MFGLFVASVGCASVSLEMASGSPQNSSAVLGRRRLTLAKHNCALPGSRFLLPRWFQKLKNGETELPLIETGRDAGESALASDCAGSYAVCMCCGQNQRGEGWRGGRAWRTLRLLLTTVSRRGRCPSQVPGGRQF